MSDEGRDGMPVDGDTEDIERARDGGSIDGVKNSEIVALVEGAIRRIMPELINVGAEAESSSGREGDCEVQAMREELNSTRRELERVRIEKVAQGREMFLREQIRSLGVRNIELAFRAVREEIEMDGDGEWIAMVKGAKVPAVQFLKSFINQNPELIPARMISGAGAPSRSDEFRDECDLDQIRPGMDPASMRRAREAVVRIIAQSKRTL
jgi:hypothetical protein